MRKSVSLILCFVCLYILFMQGFGFPSVSPAVDLLLRLLAAGSIQLFFLSCFRKKAVQLLPLLLTVLLALWGGWLFCSSPSWQNATLLGYLADYCSPAFACGLTIFLEHKLS